MRAQDNDNEGARDGDGGDGDGEALTSKTRGRRSNARELWRTRLRIETPLALGILALVHVFKMAYTSIMLQNACLHDGDCDDVAAVLSRTLLFSVLVKAVASVCAGSSATATSADRRRPQERDRRIVTNRVLMTDERRAQTQEHTGNAESRSRSHAVISILGVRHRALQLRPTGGLCYDELIRRGRMQIKHKYECEYANQNGTEQNTAPRVLFAFTPLLPYSTRICI